MPRKNFLEDLARAAQQPPRHIDQVERYDDAGFSCTYVFSTASVTNNRVVLRCLTTNVDEYPENNGYMLYTEQDNVNQLILDTFEYITPVLDGMSVRAALSEISTGLHQALSAEPAEDLLHSVNHNTREHHDGRECLDREIHDFSDYDYDYDSDVEFGFGDKPAAMDKSTQSETRPGNGQVLSKIYADLAAAKSAGFKVGVHGDPKVGGIICISIRTTKLGISDEAMKAWSLDKQHYLVLLIRFQKGYKTLMQVKDEQDLSNFVEMRVGLCRTYKPSIVESFNAFVAVGSTSFQPGPGPEAVTSGGKLETFFIGRPLNDLLKDRFQKIIQFRSWNMSWLGAETAYNEAQGSHLNNVADLLDYYQSMQEEKSERVLAPLVADDQLEHTGIANASLPLVAMQFVLRHTVRCTEFCLVCHCKVEDTFEALKPYVCSKPLCLFQFLALGFGPSVEWEIMSQPHVVDLLVSLCYVQARFGKLKDFPVGLNLTVPVLPSFEDELEKPYLRHYKKVSSSTSVARGNLAVPSFAATLDQDTWGLVPDDIRWLSPIRLRKGDWIAITSRGGSLAHHCRIVDCSPSYIQLQKPIAIKEDAVLAIDPSQPTGVILVACYTYSNDFDTLSKHQQHHAILELLKSLPSVSNMRRDLIGQRNHDRGPLLACIKHLSSPSKDLLRWIIASNRSCIMQVDQLLEPTENGRTTAGSEARVSGMDEWLQFRFAQGAPDKEQRFVDAVNNNSRDSQYPTLFAWHGSPLHNWHSIIREGLTFDEIVHGRAYGHGIYMARDVQTSLGYVGSNHNMSNPIIWPSSALKVQSVISLQEIVNAPSMFVSKKPFLVVAQKDWVQTRYLFVKSAISYSKSPEAKAIYQQDPEWVLSGSDNHKVKIPSTATARFWKPVEDGNGSPGQKKSFFSRRRFGTNVPEVDDDSLSIATLKEDHEWTHPRDHDRDIILSEADMPANDADGQLNEVGSANAVGKAGKYLVDSSKTNFVPGALDISQIKFLPPPANPSISASKALMTAFRQAIRTQQSTPLHDLGYFIDPGRVDNIYQWIVELHSFDPSLPLAKDMKNAKLTSIVLEMRFPDSFPFDPPFVRVVKPRFLPFLSGGGGHVTEGGAICMELLTSSGWSPSNSIEAVLLQVKLAMSETERPARLVAESDGRRKSRWSSRSGGTRSHECYGINEAVVAFERACHKHGWKKPQGMKGMQLSE